MYSPKSFISRNKLPALAFFGKARRGGARTIEPFFQGLPMLHSVFVLFTAAHWRRPRLWVLAWGVYVCTALVAAACLQPPDPALVCAAVRA